MKGGKILQVSFLILTIMLISTSFVFSYEKENRYEETEEEKLARMLSSFDDDIQPGKLMISFLKETSKTDAINLISKYNLTIIQGCYFGNTLPSISDSTGNINDQGVSSGSCELRDKWYEFTEELSGEFEGVPQGEEKKYAELIINEEAVTWVSPISARLPTIGSESNKEGLGETAFYNVTGEILTDEEKPNYTPYIIIFSILLVLIVFILYLFLKSKANEQAPDQI